MGALVSALEWKDCSGAEPSSPEAKFPRTLRNIWTSQASCLYTDPYAKQLEKLVILTKSWQEGHQVDTAPSSLGKNTWGSVTLKNLLKFST